MGRFLQPKGAALPTKEYRLQQRGQSWRVMRCDGWCDTPILAYAAPSQAEARRIVRKDAERLGVKPLILIDFFSR